MTEQINQLFALKSNLSPSGLSFLKESLSSDDICLDRLEELSDDDAEVMDSCFAVILNLSPEEADLLMSEIDHW